MRRFFLLALLVALAVPAAVAQTPAAPAKADSARSSGTQGEIPPSPRRVTTVPLPNGRGVFYYRAGTPGGVRIRSRRGQRVAPEPQVTPSQAVDVESARPSALESRTRAAPSEGLTRLDLLLFERDLLQAIDRRLAALDPGYRRSDSGLVLPTPQQQAPVIIVPPSPAAPAVPAPAAPRAEPPAAEPAPEPPAVEPPTDPLVEEVERAILDTGLFRTTRVNFAFGKAALLPVSEESLRAIASVLRRYPDLRIEVGGHTDSVSSDAFNLRLSQRRAESVRDFLVGSGIAADRIEAVGYGENRPVASNETETGRALNRRVEFVALNPEAAERERRTIREAEPDDDLRQIIREEFDRLRRSDSGSDG